MSISSSAISASTFSNHVFLGSLLVSTYISSVNPHHMSIPYHPSASENNSEMLNS